MATAQSTVAAAESTLAKALTPEAASTFDAVVVDRHNRVDRDDRGDWVGVDGDGIDRVRVHRHDRDRDRDGQQGRRRRLGRLGGFLTFRQSGHDRL